MLEVCEYDDGETFWREVGEPLRARAVLNNAFLGNAHRTRGGARGDIARFGVFEDDAAILGALSIPPHRLSIGADGNGERGVEALVRHLATRGTMLPGVFAATHLAGAFVTAWRTTSGRAVRVNESEGRTQNLYQVVAVKAPAGVAGAMRAARAEERALMFEWETGFARDAELPRPERDPVLLARAVDESLSDGSLLVWEADGAPVAMARQRRIGTDGVRVSGVYTPPSLRGRGYAAALTAALSQRVLDEGLFCCLHADASNALTNRLYRRIGYVNLATYADIVFSDD